MCVCGCVGCMSGSVVLVLCAYMCVCVCVYVCACMRTCVCLQAYKTMSAHVFACAKVTIIAWHQQ